MTFAPHLSRSTLAYNARSVRAGPLRSCVPPLPYATPAAVVGLRNMLPRTEWDSRSGNHDATFADRSDMPVPARHTTRLPSSMGKATFRSRIDITTAGRLGVVLLLSSPPPSRGVDPPVRPVLAPWGMMVQSASTMDWRQSIASWMVWGLTMAKADPSPRRAPLRYGADDASDNDPDSTLSFPTMDRSLVGRLRCSSVSCGACGDDGDDGDDSQEQQDRGRPLGSTCGC